MTGKSDSELVDLFRNGDETAFNTIVLRYQEKIYWVVRRFISDHDDADDIVQEVFVKAYEGLRTFRGDAQLYTWLYRIAVNASLNHIRLKRVKEFFRFEETIAPETIEHETPDHIVQSNEQREIIEQAVALLPEKQKAVFILRHYDQLAYEEIATILKTSVGGLKANYFHAVRKVERYVKKIHGL
ncbi:MAG: sigma-70 family RNA polymerase sigma factor [Ignavibacteria bacterium]|nr:sigma-70 family RNA polymerase sigma factor [Ignavibacteria bacterium]